MTGSSRTGIHAVGIDLGTTNSAVAMISDAGRSEMMEDELASVLTPSVVHFDDNEIVVGQEAVKSQLFVPELIADAAKRDVGKPFYNRPIRGRSVPPELIQAYILKHLNAVAKRRLGEDFAAVITVPAFFDERRRKSTMDSGRMAGIEVLDIVNEPTAAALAFGEQLGYLSPVGTVAKTQRVLVFDLGGGTFDVTVIELRPTEFVTLATDGDVQLGGRDFDNHIAAFAAQRFEDVHRIDPRDDPRARARLHRQAEDAKHTLTVRQHALMRVTHEGKSLEVDMTRAQFEGLTAALLERTAYTTREVLHQSGLKWTDIDRLILVGGATRMPMIGRKLNELSGLVPEQSVNPDEAVARGAAIYASYLLSDRGKNKFPLSFRIVDVNSHSLGIQGVDVATGRNENAILIPRNTPLPTKATSKFVTKKENQQSIMLKVLEGESLDPSECILIGKAVLRSIPDLPMGHPLEVTYSYGSNGRLRVELRVSDTDSEMRIELQRGDSLSESKVNTWKQIVASGHGFKSFEAMLEAVLGKLGHKPTA